MRAYIKLKDRPFGLTGLRLGKPARGSLLTEKNPVIKIRIKKPSGFARTLSAAVARFIAALLIAAVIPAQNVSAASEEIKTEWGMRETVRSGVKDAQSSPRSTRRVLLGGDTVGVKFYTGGVVAVGISDVKTGKGFAAPAYDAGLRVGDVITSIGGSAVTSVGQVQSIISASGGEELEIRFMRAGAVRITKLRAVMSVEGRYKAGVWIKDSTAGIGTVTFVTEDGIFAGLGHGICDTDTGILMPLSRGNAVRASITGVIRGRESHPGELKGVFGTENAGILISNTETGLFGLFNDPMKEGRESVELAPASEVHEGDAQIVSTVDANGPREFPVKIVRIFSGNEKTKNFLIEITDESLIALTGGIVQGMSGSPIMQDGRLIGAVTHVLVSSPQKGYGIFIENMLDAMPSLADNG